MRAFVTPLGKIGIAAVGQNHAGFSFGSCAESSGACTDEGPHPGGLENLDGEKTFFLSICRLNSNASFV
jgi:hypothetical protein